MAVPYKIVVDCEDPHGLAPFWAAAIGYVVEDHSAFIRQLLDAGQVTDAHVTTMNGALVWPDAAAVRDPDAPFDERTGIGRGGRILFQKVPEGSFAEPTTDGGATPKRAHNKVHLDLHYGPERRSEVVDRLKELGATVLWEGRQGPSTWITMADPEGNEFCVA
jgi:hypothetical protein